MSIGSGELTVLLLILVLIGITLYRQEYDDRDPPGGAA